MRALNGAPPTDFSAGVPRNLFSETTLHSAKGAGSALSNFCRFLRHIHDSTETSYGLVIEDVPEEVLCSPVIYGEWATWACFVSGSSRGARSGCGTLAHGSFKVVHVWDWVSRKYQKNPFVVETVSKVAAGKPTWKSALLAKLERELSQVLRHKGESVSCALYTSIYIDCVCCLRLFLYIAGLFCILS